MKDRNELIYRIRQIIGEEKEDGFYTPVKYNDKIIEVPNYLFKGICRSSMQWRWIRR